MLLLLIACGGPADLPSDCPPCPDCPASAGGPALDAWERGLLDPAIAELKAGVQPNGAGFQLCRGRMICEAGLGSAPGELPPGDYHMRADLRVPRLGSGWWAELRVICDVTAVRGQATDVDLSERFELKPGESGLVELHLMWRVPSPAADGARNCKATLTPVRPDGQRGAPWELKYQTPPRPRR